MPERTVTRSFRINETSFLALEEEARRRNISLNTLVNQLFSSFANFDRYLQRFGMVKISKTAYRKTLKAVPDTEIEDMAREVAQNASRMVILARYGTLSLQGILEYLRSLADYAYFFEYSEVISPERRRVITLTHDLGERFSVFLVAYSRSLFEMIAMSPKLTPTEDSITISL